MHVRAALRQDLESIVAMLADDALGAQREEPHLPLPEAYLRAFERINANPEHQLLVVENSGGEVVGCMQLSLLQYLTYRGGLRAQIESVRTRADMRGQGIGELLIKHAIAEARAQGAHVIQLTSDKQRPAALHFYEKLGFRSTHAGMKLHLS